MLANMGSLMFWTVVIMSGLCAVGVGIGALLASAKQRRYLKVFNEALKED